MLLIGCKTTRNVAEATISTPDESYTMFIKGRYTGSFDKYTYIMRLRDTASISGPVLASGGILVVVLMRERNAQMYIIVINTN